MQNTPKQKNGKGAYKKQRMFSNPFSFKGRIRRTEYCISFMIYFFLSTYISVQVEFPLDFLSQIPLLWFILAQGSKRNHDYGDSGWWQIIFPLSVWWMMFLKGDFYKNEYGEPPI